MCRFGTKTKLVSAENMQLYKGVAGGLKPQEPPKAFNQDQGTRSVLCHGEIPSMAFGKQIKGVKKAVERPPRRPRSL